MIPRTDMLEVIVIENHGVPLATVEIDVRNGSFTQTPEYAGLAHLYEHMFFRANATYPQSGAFLDPHGGISTYAGASAISPAENWVDLMLAPRS